MKWLATLTNDELERAIRLQAPGPAQDKLIAERARRQGPGRKYRPARRKPAVRIYTSRAAYDARRA